MKTYDSKCYELAAAFLSDEPTLNTPANIDKLAGRIQERIEDWIEDMRPNYCIAPGGCTQDAAPGRDLCRWHLRDAEMQTQDAVEE